MLVLLLISLLSLVSINAQNTAVDDLPDANVFVTLHVEDKNVQKHVYKMQQKLLAIDPRFNTSFQSLTSLHVTFDLFYVDDLETAKSALEFAASMSYAFYGPLNIKFQKIEAFGDLNLVSTPDPKSTDILTKYHVKTNEIFKSFGFEPRNKFAYRPHMTLLTLEYSELRHKWDFLLSNHTNMGHSSPIKLQICTLTIDPGAPYYTVLAEAYFPI